MESTNNSTLKNMGSISNLSEYLKLLESIHLNNQNYKFAYRGHYLKKFELIPGIGRIQKNVTVEKEREMLWEFKKNAHSYLNGYCPNTQIDWLFLAQHYGLKTRLLDWTLNPLVALFFACFAEGLSNKMNGRVIIKRVCTKDAELKEDTRNFDPFSQEEAERMEKIFIIPDYFDLRLKNQQAAFTISSTPSDCAKIEGFLIDVKKSKKICIMQELSECGISEEFVYPTLDRLCSRIKKEYL